MSQSAITFTELFFLKMPTKPTTGRRAEKARFRSGLNHLDKDLSFPLASQPFRSAGGKAMTEIQLCYKNRECSVYIESNISLVMRSKNAQIWCLHLCKI